MKARPGKKQRTIVNKDDYSKLRNKLFLRMLGLVVIAALSIGFIYFILLLNGGGNFIVSIFVNLFGISTDTALSLYHTYFRSNATIIILIAIIFAFFVLLRLFLRWFTRYFNEVNQGINALLDEDGKEIVLSEAMAPIAQKLNTVRQTLAKRTSEAQEAEKRKNDLVMYLAHDIRTPLTSVIGYLSLLNESPDMPIEQKAKYVKITLDKAYRLEKLINEFFEITRYNLQHMQVNKEKTDLYYMLVQLIDEFYPILSLKGNTASLKASENLSIYCDPEKLARVFNNILRNAAAYSYPDTQIIIAAEQKDEQVIITFINQGKTIPKEKLAVIFERFYRMDEARNSDSGGAGLGLSIAQEIVAAHGGSINAESNDNITVFNVVLPAGEDKAKKTR